MLYFIDFGCLALDLPVLNSVRMKLNVNKKLLPSKISFFGLMSGKFYTLFLQNAQILPAVSHSEKHYMKTLTREK